MKVLEIKEQKDGSAIMNYEITAEERKMFKKIYGKKKLTNEDINKIVLDAIKVGVKSEDKKDKKAKSKSKV